MLVICSLVLTVAIGWTNVMTKADVEGSIIKEGEYNYLVDFSKGVKRFNLPEGVTSSDYSKVLVKKQDCIKE